MKYPYQKALSGIKLQRRADILVNGKVASSETGRNTLHRLRLLQSHRYYSLAGRQPFISRKGTPYLSIDLMPNRTEEEVIEFLETNQASSRTERSRSSLSVFYTRKSSASC
ncbi:hypothetical protein LWE69_06130 [Paenibacillus sp. UKAQ_18]|nr:hypothetical protein [Paenibacillus sp. UKAQ_18]